MYTNPIRYVDLSGRSAQVVTEGSMVTTRNGPRRVDDILSVEVVGFPPEYDYGRAPPGEGTWCTTDQRMCIGHTVTSPQASDPGELRNREPGPSWDDQTTPLQPSLPTQPAEDAIPNHSEGQQPPVTPSADPDNTSTRVTQAETRNSPRNQTNRPTSSIHHKTRLSSRKDPTPNKKKSVQPQKRLVAPSPSSRPPPQGISTTDDIYKLSWGTTLYPIDDKTLGVEMPDGSRFGVRIVGRAWRALQQFEQSMGKTLLLMPGVDIDRTWEGTERDMTNGCDAGRG